MEIQGRVAAVGRIIGCFEKMIKSVPVIRRDARRSREEGIGARRVPRKPTAGRADTRPWGNRPMGDGVL